MITFMWFIMFLMLFGLEKVKQNLPESRMTSLNVLVSNQNKFVSFEELYIIIFKYFL